MAAILPPIVHLSNDKVLFQHILIFRFWVVAAARAL
ncbi:hypothetical protein M621_00260 [Serratia plymuthica S13]|uniref:Uncharacterized protein n=1 Tax=Serratia plymuthica S13 TaxID=1348660 RepID=S4YPL9_SERPL|nr:hypothetical protein M621_00260 [Serratia plymuthica S13]